ncbi:MAG: Peptidase M15D vanX D-ala-D-ala dipeptidase [candidate division TM6 bacterium GW2011_GWF2_28_16]|nr:MAG: Peptidase M15D vanX D-ala-D-ala dipeptidase [candidate division TM6 bacterium GW2011_GWF2_28_16]
MFNKKIFSIFIFYILFFVYIFSNLVEVIKINPNIKLDIRYATENNFTKKIVYPSAQCFLQQELVKELDLIQKELENDGLGLKIYDGYRPLSVQKIFWDICPNPNYVANPYNGRGSKHNRGTAVDLTLIDLKTGQELEMPSEFDEFTDRAHRYYSKMTSEVAKKNCKKLEDLMHAHGFTGEKTEWWHYNWKDWEKFAVLDISFNELN